ncbi:MAG: flagellar basal body-associated FliL family protein [bacterium]|jgi:flagellar basal body-associated protein FliL
MANEPEGGKKKGFSLPMPVLIAAAVVVTLALSVGLSFLVVKNAAPKMPAGAGDEEAANDGEEVEVEPVITIFDLPTFRANLAGGGYIKATISLELADRSAALMALGKQQKPAEGKEEAPAEGGSHASAKRVEYAAYSSAKEAPAEAAPAEPAEPQISPFVEHLTMFMPKYQDKINEILRSKTLAELSEPKAQVELGKEIKKEINLMLDPELGQIQNVYFKEFVTTG